MLIKYINRNFSKDNLHESNNHILLGIYPKDYKSFYSKDTCTWMFIAAQFTIAKTWNQPKCPLMIDWTGKMWHIYTMEYHAAIKNDEFVSFVGTWMNQETIILSKLTQEQKIKHHMFSLIGGCWTMRTHGHREGSITRVCRGEIGEGQWGVGSWGGITWGEMPDIGDGDGGSKPHCYVCTYATILHVLHMYPRIM